MTKLDIKKIEKFRSLFPNKVEVSVNRTEDGTFTAKIHTFNGLFTEGNNFSELMEMVNDAIKTYFEIPEKFVPYMPNYIPPLEVAQQLDIFPVGQEINKNFVLPISREKVTS